MKWDNFRVGDLVQSDRDLLLVLEATHTSIVLLGIDIKSMTDYTGDGIVEIWDRSIVENWMRVAKDTRLILRTYETQE